jgi:serine/threonine protein kinase
VSNGSSREVEAAERTSDGYTLAADMWSLGAVTFTLLAGNSSLPRDEYSQHSQQNIVQFVQGIGYGEYLTSRAIEFLRGLLIEDAKMRMTASQALRHMWFKKPVGEAVAIEEACKRINKYWKPRENFEGVIEDLPDRKMILQRDPPSNASPRARRKVPDINPYPFIGLDYRLNPRTQSSRVSILSNLKQTEALFIVDKGYQDNQAKPVQDSHSHRQTTRVISIPAADMFGAALRESAAQDSLAFGEYGEDDEEDEKDELSLLLTNIGEHRFEGELQKSHDGRPNITLSGRLGTSDSIHIPRTKQQLLGSKCSVARGARVNLARRIPRHSGAKAYGDAVRQMMKQNHTLLAGSRCHKETLD